MRGVACSELTLPVLPDEVVGATIDMDSGTIDFRRGEVNGDGVFDVADVVFLLASLFSGGPSTSCADATDANDDGGIDISDAVLLLNALFVASATLPAPGSVRCGPDPTADSLDCAEPCP